MLIWISIVLWIGLGGAAAAALFRGGSAGRHSSGKAGVWLWRMCAVAAFLLFMRPHEDWLGGQDGGTYLNLGGRFAQEDRIFYTDPLLEAIPAEARHYFRYFMHGPYPSKFGTEHIFDIQKARIGPWFPSAYPILLSTFPRLGVPWMMLYVIPLAAWVNGLLLRRLATLLFSNPFIGRIAAVLYWFTPLVLWHGRGPRPEFLSSLLILSSLLLLIIAQQEGRTLNQRRCDCLFAAAAVSLAPFFHVTAWNAALPLAAWVGWRLLRGDPAPVFYPLVALSGFLFFCVQTLFWTDTYNLSRFIEPVLIGGRFWPGAVVLTLAVLALTIGFHVRNSRRPEGPGSDLPFSARHAGARMILMAGFLIGMYLWAAQTRPHVGIHYQQQFIYRTDLIAAADMFSRLWLFTAAAGLVWLSGSRSRHAFRTTMVLFSGLGMAAFSIGNMYDFFMMRYLVPAFAPLMVIGMVKVFHEIATRFPGSLRQAAVALCVLVFLAGATSIRLHLLTGREFRGLYRALQSITEQPQKQDAWMLVEYSRTGAPVDHVFAIPALGLNNERISDRAQRGAERAWADLMRAHPEQPAYLLSPYDGPVSPHLVFEPVASEFVDSEIIQGRRWGLPREMRPWRHSLNLYRIHLPEHAPADSAVRTYTRRIDSGRLGLRGMELPEYKPWAVNTIAGEEDGSFTARWPEAFASDAGEMKIFFHTLSDSPLVERRDASGEWITVPAEPLFDGWWIGRWRQTPADPGTIQWRIPDSAVVNAAWSVCEGEAVLLRPGLEELKDRRMEPLPLFGGRAAEKGAQINLPRMNDASSLALLLLLPEQNGMFLDVQVATSGGGSVTHRLRTGLWLWSVWPNLVEEAQTVLSIEALPSDPLNQDAEAPFNFMWGGIAVPAGAYP